MSDPMTDPRDLIKAATPLPWTVHAESREVWSGDDHVAEADTDADAALIVYAVNNLPALLDVADALERLLSFLEGGTWGENSPEVELAEARRAPARLEEHR